MVALRAVAPGTPLREGLDRILQAHMGALIVIGDGPDVLSLCSGGFLLDAEFTPQRLSELVTDDYMLVNSDASVQGKASYLADFRVPGFTLDRYEIEQPFYRVHHDTAITGWRFHLTWTQDGKRQARFLRIVHSWVKEKRRWRIEYTQLTRIPD